MSRYDSNKCTLSRKWCLDMTVINKLSRKQYLDMTVINVHLAGNGV